MHTGLLVPKPSTSGMLLPPVSGNLTLGGGVPVKLKIGGCDQSLAEGKSTLPPENLAPVKSSSLPQNAA